MTNVVQTAVQHWSTDAFPVSQRLNQFAAIMEDVLVPVRASTDAPDFGLEMSFADFGPITVARQRGTPHVCWRSKREIDRSNEHCFNLIVNPVTSWNFLHRRHQRLQPGDLAFHDSNYVNRIEQPMFEAVNIQFSDAWIRQWVHRPAALLGNPISCVRGWGRALSAYVLELRPELVANAPLPVSLIADHLGALLVLVAEERGVGDPKTPSRAVAALAERIRDCIRVRCCEITLTVQNVATSLNISPRTLHRSLAAQGQAFGVLLMQARANVAARMLATPRFDSLTTAEIGRRAGFSDPSHFTRVLRRWTGRTPLQTRRIRRSGS